jgi:superfamily II helicase
MSIGKGLVGEIAGAKKKIQNKMMEYLLLVYLTE